MVWCTLPPYERRRRKKIYVAAAAVVAGRCLWPPLESLDQMISAAAAGTEEKVQQLLGVACSIGAALSGRVAAAHTHAVTCCWSATAAHLVSRRERDEFGKGGRIQHTFPHCWAHVTERGNWGGDKRFWGEERLRVICCGCNETRNCVRQKIE